MALDFCVALECPVKRDWGNGDAQRGTVEVLERLKAKGRAEALREVAQERGMEPAQMKVRLQSTDRDGNPVARDVSIAELEEEALPLESYAATCVGCPGAVTDETYSCCQNINYPVSVAAEHWLLSRMQPHVTLGTSLCLEYMAQSGNQGDGMKRMRAAGFFESKTCGQIVFKKNLSGEVALSADQLLESMVLVGDTVAPDHCFGVLVWLDALRVDGQLPTGTEHRAVLTEVMNLKSPEEKRRRTALELGPPSPPETEPFKRLLTAMYVSWLNDVPLLVSA